MPLQKMSFRPGLYREGTSYSNEGGWYDGDKVRFRSGLPEKIGGWSQVSSSQFLGTARSLWTWVDLSSNVYIGIGTNSKYYIYNGGIYNDITPVYQTSTLAASSISTTASSTAVFITDTAYNPAVGDYINFTSSTTVGGVILSGQYSVVSVPTPSSYSITVSSAATSTAFGGTGTVIQYLYPTGANSYAISNGWGTGPWGGVLNPLTATLANNPFSVTSASSTVIVSQPAHGIPTGNYVSFSGSTSITGSNIPTSYIDNTYQVTSLTASTYSITLPYSYAGSFVTGKQYIIATVGTTNFTAIGASVASVGTLFTATGAGTGTGTATIVSNVTTTGGGSAVVVQEQSGTRGWGTAYTGTTGVGTQLRLWSNDNYGQDLVIAPRGGAIYYWQDSNGVGTRAVSLSSLANSTASTITTASFASGAGTAIVSSALGIYPYAYVTGTGIPANTQVSSSYVIGSTSVPLTNNTTASQSAASLTFSYAGQYVPVSTLQVITSAIQEFVIAFGSNSYNGGTYSSTFNPMLVRWSDQANAYQWVPQVTNQSGEFALSNGSFIMGARATRQEILIWTNTALYTMQYIGYPYVWSFNILMDNISVMSPNCMVTVNNITYWMGTSKFYKYDGTVHTLPCALRQYIFDDLNQSQSFQVFAGGNEGFNEVWWFYVSNESINNSIDKYVIYNYLENTWSYGTFETVQVTAGNFVVGQQYVIATQGNTNFTAAGAVNNNVGTYFIATSAGSGTGTAWAMNGRSAWIQNNIQSNPVAADYNSRLLSHESGVDDAATSQVQPIYAYIQSSDFGIMASDNNNSGQHFGFVWRILPDVNFNGSNTTNTALNPQVTFSILPRQNSGTDYGTADAPVVTSNQSYAYPTPQEYTIQQFTGEVYTRLRGRQMSLRVYSNQLGTQWQLGTNRYDVKQDGRR